MTQRWALAIALAALALVAAGCGGTSKEEYQDEVNELRERLGDEGEEMARRFQDSGTLAEGAPVVVDAAEAIEEAADDFEEVEPPDDAEAEHEEIVSGTKRLARDFRKAAGAATVDNPKPILELFSELGQSGGSRKIEAALRKLGEMGYEFER